MKEVEKKHERYSRQIILKEFGEVGQQKLFESKVLVVGAGGLGCAALQYLAAAGIGTIGVMDDDVVTLDNLHRQILYTNHDIGHFKATLAKEKLMQLNSEISVVAYCERLRTENALSIMAEYDIIIDGTDNFASRYLINDACVLLNKPLVYGAVSQYEGQVAILNNRKDKNSLAVNYRDLFPEPPKENEFLNCAEAGVLGILPGVIGILQAGETIKLITGIGQPLLNKLLTYNALSNHMYEVSLVPNENTRLLIPSDAEAFKKMNYEWLCSADKDILEIDGNLFDQLINKHGTQIVDVREIGEQPFIKEFKQVQIPLSQIKERILEIKSDTIIVYCQSGNRSLQAARQLSTIFGVAKKVYSLQGGIVNWLKNNSSKVK